MSETTKDLVRQGLTAARVGDVEDAHRLLTQATEQVPDDIDAWLGLAGVVDSLEEKKRCFTRVLELDPHHSEARAGLERVEQKLAETGQTAAPARPQADTGLGYCYRHPQTETGLRCNRCNKFLCPKCAVRTPVGFRCPDCIREQEDKYYSGGNMDYLIAAVIALPLSAIVAALFSFILSGFWILWTIIIAMFVAPAATGFIAEAVRWAVQKRRSRYLRHVVIACLVLGTAPFLLLFLLSGSYGGLVAPGALIFLGWATISARLR